MHPEYIVTSQNAMIALQYEYLHQGWNAQTKAAISYFAASVKTMLQFRIHVLASRETINNKEYIRS